MKSIYNTFKKVTLNRLSFGVVLVLMFGLSSSTLAQSIQIQDLQVSGCYLDNAGVSKATVRALIRWTGTPPTTQINVSVNGTGGTNQTVYGGGPFTLNVNISCTTINNKSASLNFPNPQEVSFEIPADGSARIMTAKFANNTGTVTQNFNAPAACPKTACSSGGIGGIVFNDYNANGLRDVTSPGGVLTGETVGVSGVTVQAIDKNGTVLTTTTDVYGNYAFPTTLAFPVRVEFTTIPAIYAGTSTPSGTGAQTTVQFIAASKCDVNLGVNAITDFCNMTPRVFVPCYVNGDPLKGGTSANDAAVVSVNLGSTGNTFNQPTKTVWAQTSQVGTIWGEAYNRFTKKMFISTLIRRHSGFGPSGVGGIYLTNTTLAPASSTTPFINIQGMSGTNLVSNPSLVTNTARALPKDKSAPNASHDPLAFPAVGAEGLGDIDISEDGNTLYTVNIKDKSILTLDMTAYNGGGAAPTSLTSTVITSHGCVNGEWRPFGLKFYKGNLYIGGVCDASVSQSKSDLKAVVLKWDLASTFTKVMDFPLTYQKGFPFSTDINRTGWYPWTNDFSKFITGTTFSGGKVVIYPQPMFTDIEFDIDGSMVLGFSDRTGLQTGFNNWQPSSSDKTLYVNFAGGDILQAYSSNGNFILENKGKAGPFQGYATLNYQGPGNGEFYNDDWCYNGTKYHSEAAFGGLAIRPGSGRTVATFMDPVDGVGWSGGFRMMNNNSGQRDDAMTFYAGANGSPDQISGSVGKAVGLGDVEIACDNPTYLEIGNRVWFDKDGDGIQDPDEKGLTGISVKLYNAAGTLVSTKTTDANGNWFFSNTDGLMPNANYNVVFGDGQQVAGEPNKITLAGAQYPLTVPNTGQGATAGVKDINDSDASLTTAGALTNKIIIPVTTGVATADNHTLDVGFQCLRPVFNLTSTPPTCNITTALNNGKISLPTAVLNGNRYGISTGATYSGAAYAASTPIGTAPKDLQTSISNAGQTYTIRFFNGSDDCFKDTTVVIAPVSCVGCATPTTASLSATKAGVCVGETFALAATFSGGASATLSQTNGGGTLSATTLSANGSFTYQSVAADAGKTITVTITVPDPDGAGPCVAATNMLSFQIYAKPAISNTTPICAVDGKSYSFNFTTAAGSTLTTTAGTISGTQVINIPQSTTQVILKAVNANGCKDSVIVVRPVPCAPCPKAGKDTLLCDASQLQLLAPDAGETWSILSQPAGGVATLSANGFAENMAVNGVYQYLISNPSGCKDTITVARSKSQSIGLCKNTTRSLATQGGVTNVQWWRNGQMIADETKDSLLVIQAGSYYYTGKDANSCDIKLCCPIVVSDSLCCPVYTAVFNPTNSNTLSVCEGTGDVNLTGIVGGGATGGTITKPVDAGGTLSSTTFSGTTFSISYTPVAADLGKTLAFVLNSNDPAGNGGCPKGVDTLFVTINPKPTFTVAPTPNICIGSSVNLTSLISNYATYINPTWKLNGGLIVNPLAVTPTIVGLNAYTFIAESAGACRDSVQVNVMVLAIPNAGADMTACLPKTTFNLATAAPQTTWSVLSQPTTGVAIDATTGAITGISAAGVHKFILKSTLSTCADTVTITVNPQPSVTLAGTTVCEGDKIALNALPTSGATYLWSGPSNASGSLDSLVIPNAAAANAGTYQVIMSDANGCADTTSAQVAVNLKPVLTVSAATPAGCTSEVVSTSVTGGTGAITYLWSNGSTSPNPTFTTADTYTVTITDAQGCKATGSVTTTVANPPSVNLSVTDVLCFGDETGTATATITGGSAPAYTFVWKRGGSTVATVVDNTSPFVQQLANVTAGDITVEITAGTCTIIKTDTIREPAVLEASLIGTNPICAGENNGSISVDVTGGKAAYTYLWSDGVTTEDRTGLLSGTYQVTITDANGCVIERAVTLTAPAALVVTAFAPAVCAGSALVLDAQTTAVGATFQWSGPGILAAGSDGMGQSLTLFNTTAAYAGLYTVTMKVGTCSATSSVTATIKPSDKITIIGTACEAGDNTYKINFTHTNTALGVAAFDSATNAPIGMASANAITGIPAGTAVYLKSTGATDCIDIVPVMVPKCVPLGSIGNYVWTDVNNNGIQDEPYFSGLNGVKIRLLKETTPGTYVQIDSTITADLEGQPGYYNFPDLTSGNYKVQLVPTSIPTGFELSPKVDATADNADIDFNNTTGLSPVVAINTLLATTDVGRNNPTIDGAVRPILGSIGNYVWFDANEDGKQDASEIPVKGVRVTLLDEFGVELAETETGVDGKYLFPDLPAGKYIVQFDSLPPIYKGLTMPNASGVADGLDSDADPITMRTGIIDLTAGENDDTNDAGLTPRFGSIGNYVWEDADKDGIQDATEFPVKDVVVRLLNASGTVLQTTTTDPSGKYLFDSLGSGQYKVEFVKPAFYPTFTTANVSPDTTDSDVNAAGLSHLITIDVTKVDADTLRNNMHIDAGLVLPVDFGSIGDFVWKDSNNDGIQNETTANSGGVKDIVVELYKDNVLFKKDTTDATGKYFFENLAAGTYKIKIVAATIPSGCSISSKQDAPTGTENTDSDVNPTTGFSNDVVIDPIGSPATKDVTNLDAALYSPLGSIGDFVWKDTNNDGIQNETIANSGGVAGVHIELYKDGVLFKKDTTDATGKYLFTNLASGTYKIKIVASTIPAGCSISTKQDAPAGTDNTDSDVNGTIGSPTFGESGNYIIDIIGSPTTKDVTSVDAALYTPVIPCNSPDCLTGTVRKK